MGSPGQPLDLAARRLAREASRHALALVRELVWNCLLASTWRLPLTATACVFACLVIALVPAAALSCRGACLLRASSLSGNSGIALLLVLYVAAGILWGLHGTIHRAVRAGLSAFEARVAKLFDVLTAPLVELGNDSLPSLPVASVRDYFATTTSYIAGDYPQARLGRRVAGWAVRLAFRGPQVAVEQVLARIEQAGHTHVSLASFKTCARDELIARASAAVRVQLFQFDLAMAAIVLGLLVVPAVLVAWLAA